MAYKAPIGPVVALVKGNFLPWACRGLPAPCLFHITSARLNRRR